MSNRDTWNKCQECGRFIAFEDILDGNAEHWMREPDSDLGVEKWVTLCPYHAGNHIRLVEYRRKEAGLK